MDESELKGYEVLLRVATALEGIQEQLTKINQEGLTIFGGQTFEDN